MSMVINGASFRCIWWWDRHFADTEENVRTTIMDSQGLVSDTIYDMMREMQAAAIGTRAENFMWIADISPDPGKRVTEQEWERMRQIIEEKRGLKGQMYFVIEQEKADGRVHRHLVESRIDRENGRAIPDGEDAKICHAASRQICEEFGWERNISPFDRDREGPRPKRAPKRWEMYRGMKTGIDPRDITAEVTALFEQSQNGKEFQAALQSHGYPLVTGRRGLLILDSAGKEHSLARRIEGVNAAELTAFMRDVDRQALPTLEQGKAQYQERKIAGLEADRATVHAEIEWQEALDKAAIAKEAREQQFVEPKDRETETRAGREQGTTGRRKERQEERQEEKHAEKKWPVTPPPHQAWPRFEKAAIDVTRDERVENLKGPAAKVWDAFCHSDSAKAYAAALDEQGIMFAAVTKEEAKRSQREAAFAKELGRRTPRFMEGEIVIVTEPRPEYQRNGEIIEPPRIHKLDQSLAAKLTRGLDDAHKLQGIDATLKASDERARQRAAEWREIRLQNATNGKGQARTAAANIKGGIHRSAAIIGKAASFAAPIGKVFDAVGGMVESLAAPKLTPEQIRDGDKAKARREAEADTIIDFSRVTAETAQQRRQMEQDREADRKHDGGGRER